MYPFPVTLIEPPNSIVRVRVASRFSSPPVIPRPLITRVIVVGLPCKMRRRGGETWTAKIPLTQRFTLPRTFTPTRTRYSLLPWRSRIKICWKSRTRKRVSLLLMSAPQFCYRPTTTSPPKLRRGAVQMSSTQLIIARLAVKSCRLREKITAILLTAGPTR